MHYWLMKSEPDAFSIDDLARVKIEPWTGVRNYQARNFMRDGMRPGDGVLFYHSSCAEPGVVGLAEVASPAYPDPTQFQRKSDYFDPKSPPANPRWMLVDIAFERKLKRTITLTELKQQSRLDGFALLQRGNRLSVLPVSKAEWNCILALE
jgi:predicted RNA-binding protein with PUA-like domain